MTMDYTSIVLSAYNAIKDYGSAATIQVSTKATYNPSTDAHASAATNYPTYALIRNYTENEVNRTDLIKAGDKEMIIPAYGLPRLDTQPGKIHIRVYQGGRTWQTINVKTVEPGGTAILFKLQARG